MDDGADPVERGADGTMELYGIATWEPRTFLDRIAGRVYGVAVFSARAVVVLLALAILAGLFLQSGLALVTNPFVGAFTVLSVLPAFVLAAYIWHADVTGSEPLPLLVGTFLLGVLFSMFALVLNTVSAALTAVPILGFALFFYLVVAPVEEAVKLLAVRLYAFRSGTFDAVVDGAVYGAVAGLGFATIENAIYITRGLDPATFGAGALATAGQTATFRLLAGPGHVIYSAFAGYYLGLAKFNREHAGPIVVKGLLVAAFIHGTYNTLVTYVPAALAILDVGIPETQAFIVFVVLYDGTFGYLLIRKLSQYRRAYHEVNTTKRVRFEQEERRADDGERVEE